jgi:hypothetical protein
LEHHPPSGPAELKQLCLQVFGAPSEARVVTAADLKEYLSWYRPRRASNADKRAGAMVEQAAALGVTGLGALASFAQPPSATALDRFLPARVGHVLIQADLTAIAPGPLTPEAASELGTLADVESRGGATVYRFSPASLARAHALGWTVDDILATLTKRSRTPLPQPLEYQVRELNRPGRRPAGTIGMAADGRLVKLGHRPPLRASPSVELNEPGPGQPLDDATLDSIVSALRKSEAAPDEYVDQGTTSEHFWAAPLETLREAVETQEVVWLGYVDARGESREKVVHVVGVDEGQVTAKDTQGATISLPVHRVSAAHIIRSQR